MSGMRWRSDNGWHGKLQIGRLQVGYHVYRHVGTLPDRWVIQPWLIYDEQAKRKAGEKP